jgi:Xaa-Pro aminopeptidase
MYPHQFERLTEVLEREGLEALVATTPENVFYVTGFRGATPAIRSRRFAAFGRGGTALVVPAADLASVAADAVAVDHVRCFGGFALQYAPEPGPLGERIQRMAEDGAPTPEEALARALEALGVRQGRVGLDEGAVTAQGWQRLAARLHGVTLAPAADALLAARRIKSPYEIECLQRALGVAEEALNAVLQMLKPGVTEREAVTAYETEVIRRGGTPGVSLIAMGDRCWIPAPVPTDRALRMGDLVRFDVGAGWKGYHGSVARTAVMGEPAPRQQALHDAVQAGLEAAVAAVRPGATAGRILDAAVEAVRGAGIADYRRDRAGHGVGLEPWERPELAAGDTTPLEAGEVLAIEVPCYEVGGCGLAVRDTVLVTRGGSHTLNRSVHGLVVLD